MSSCTLCYFQLCIHKGAYIKIIQTQDSWWFALPPLATRFFNQRGAAAIRTIHMELLRSNSASPGAKVSRCRSPVSNGPWSKCRTSWAWNNGKISQIFQAFPHPRACCFQYALTPMTKKDGKVKSCKSDRNVRSLVRGKL